MGGCKRNRSAQFRDLKQPGKINPTLQGINKYFSTHLQTCYHQKIDPKSRSLLTVPGFAPITCKIQGIIVSQIQVVGWLWKNPILSAIYLATLVLWGLFAAIHGIEAKQGHIFEEVTVRERILLYMYGNLGWTFLDYFCQLTILQLVDWHLILIPLIHYVT